MIIREHHLNLDKQDGTELELDIDGLDHMRKEIVQEIHDVADKENISINDISVVFRSVLYHEYGECYNHLEVLLQYETQPTEDEMKKIEEENKIEKRLENVVEFFEFHGLNPSETVSTNIFLVDVLESGLIDYSVKDLDEFIEVKEKLKNDGIVVL